MAEAAWVGSIPHDQAIPLLPPAFTPDMRAHASLLAFWADAGVDVCLEEAPVDRLADGVRRARTAPGAPRLPPAREKAAPSELTAVIAQAEEAAASAPDLTSLQAAIADYHGCPLRALGAKTTVFARGDPNAPVMIIGEGPGAEEDAQGLPFVGRAGKLLDRMLGAAGLTDRVFITNVVFWRPPSNRNPTAEEQAACAPFVERAIELVRPKFLVMAGGVAAKTLLKRPEGILSLRGQWFDWVSNDGETSIPALPMLHPAFLLRQPAAKKKAWQDLLTLVSRLDAQA